MSDRPARPKPKFAEALTHVRHANTVIRRLGSQSGMRSLVPEPDPEHTVVRGPTGFGDPSADFGGTAPSLPSSHRPMAEDTDRQAPAWPGPGSAMNLDTNPKQSPDAATGEHGKIYVVFGCRGGAGATTVSVNLGAELARSQRGCVVVDLDLQMGDVLCALDLQPTATISELLSEIDELDESSLRRRLTSHRSGLFAVSQGDRFDQLESLKPDRIPALIVGLSRQFGSVIVDGLRDFSDLSISALDMADVIILVVPEDVAGVKNASRCLEVFGRLGYGEQKIALVVNRHDRKAKVTPAAIAATLKRQPIAVLTQDARTAQTALDEGMPIADVSPKSLLRKDLAALASRLSGGATPPVEAAGGLFRTLFGGKR